MGVRIGGEKDAKWAVVVAQLVEWSLPTPLVWIQLSANFIYSVNCKDESKEKEARDDQTKCNISLSSVLTFSAYVEIVFDHYVLYNLDSFPIYRCDCFIRFVFTLLSTYFSFDQIKSYEVLHRPNWHSIFLSKKNGNILYHNRNLVIFAKHPLVLPTAVYYNCTYANLWLIQSLKTGLLLC